MNTRQKLHQMHLNEWTSRFADQELKGIGVDVKPCKIPVYADYTKREAKEKVL